MSGEDPTRLFIKDETAHPSGNLKHRLARQLVLNAVCSGRVGPSMLLTEASSGSTAISCAAIARLIGLPLLAVVPRQIAREKAAAIEAAGASLDFVDRLEDAPARAAAVAEMEGGHFLDQFVMAERVADWRGPTSLGAELVEQLGGAAGAEPDWIVLGVGTGGTLAALGRHLRYRRLTTRICLADPLASVHHQHWRDRRVTSSQTAPSLVEGIGAGRCRPGFLPSLVDNAVAVPDGASFAAARVLANRTGRRFGPSSGTNLWAALAVASRGQGASIATIACDSGDCYASTVYCDDWLRSHQVDIRRYEDEVDARLGDVVPADFSVA
jgi:cysteine synthase